MTLRKQVRFPTVPYWPVRVVLFDCEATPTSPIANTVRWRIPRGRARSAGAARCVLITGDTVATDRRASALQANPYVTARVTPLRCGRRSNCLRGVLRLTVERLRYD